jgi:hypothetical protein
MKVGDWVASRTLGWVGEVVEVDDNRWMNRIGVKWHTGVLQGDIAHPHTINIVPLTKLEARNRIQQQRKNQ